MSDESASVPTCSYIRESGDKCNAVALKGQDRCYFHHLDRQRREQLKQYRGTSSPHVVEAFELPPLETPDDVQICLSNLFHAVAARRVLYPDIDRLLAILRLASRNLRMKQDFNKSQSIEQNHDSHDS